MRAVLADENIPQASVRALREGGLDVVYVSEAMPGTSDSELLSVARTERRLLLTFDRDFGDLIYRHRELPPPAVVYLRFLPASPMEPAAVFQDLLDHGEIELQGRFTVVTRKQVRQRPLPEGRPGP